jgi:hypothetical protein
MQSGTPRKRGHAEEAGREPINIDAWTHAHAAEQAAAAADDPMGR